MEKSCRIAPVVFVRVGTRIEERDSKLFADIKKAVGDRETAWKMWAYTKTSEFKNRYKNVEFDEQGEVTFPSLIKALGLEDIYNEQKTREQAARDYGFEGKTFKQASEASSKAFDFNGKEKKLVALVKKTSDGYVVEVTHKTPVTMEKAKTQAFNSALAKEILGLLQSMGFNVGFSSDPKFEGIFDPTNAQLHDGLLEVIRISRGELGEQALPEEFAHLIIEGLIDHPLVQRLLASIDMQQVKEILGDAYESYAKEYQNDELKLKKEVAGKILADYIKKKGTIRPFVITRKENLLKRVWSWAKDKFSKITKKQISDARLRAEESIAGLYEMISSGRVTEIISKEKIISGDTLYQLDKDLDTLEKIAKQGEMIMAQTLRTERQFSSKGKASKETGDILKNLQKLNSEEGGENFLQSIYNFLQGAQANMERIIAETEKLDSMMKDRPLTEIRQIQKVAKIAKLIIDYCDGYEDVLQYMATLNLEENREILGISKDNADLICETANSALQVLNQLRQWKKVNTFNILYYACRTVYKNDRVKGTGSKRNDVLSLSEMISHAERDINFVDRWLSAMSDADDPLLTFVDSLVKNQQYERDNEVMDINDDIYYWDRELKAAGYTSDFMIELGNDGVPTGRIISEYDFDTYTEEKNKQIEQWREEGYGEEEISALVHKWVNGIDPKTGKFRRIRIYVDPAMQELHTQGRDSEIPDDAIVEYVPNPEVYDKYAKRIDNLPEAQKTYYYRMLNHKRKMMTKIPHAGQGIYKAIYISKGLVDGILDGSTGDAIKATKDYYARKFFRRPDDFGFGDVEDLKEDIKQALLTYKEPKEIVESIISTLEDRVDDDVRAIIRKDAFISAIKAKKYEGYKFSREKLNNLVETLLDILESQNFYIIDTSLGGKKYQKVPVYYTKKLKDMRMLSTDFTGSMIAYSAMAVNYEKMNEVAAILEVVKDHAGRRGLRERVGQASAMSKFKAMGKLYKVYVEKAGVASNSFDRLVDYIDSAVYEKRKLREGVIPGVNLDVAKTLDTIKDYTGIIGLGFNIFSTFSNIAVGKVQQWIEACGNEYFGVESYAKAIGQYSANIIECVAEMGSPVKKNKLSLLIQMFDPMGDYFEEIRKPSSDKYTLSKILGTKALGYIGMNAGEHLLRCQTMLAILNETKLIDAETNEKISLYDALEVVEDDRGVYKLKLKENLYYERDVIDQEGTKETNKNFGRPKLNEDGSKKKEKVDLKEGSNELQRFLFKKKTIIKKVNDGLNGAFNANDKGAAHKYALLRMLLQFRQWMPAHYNRRFARAHWDNDLEIFREGFYTTVGKFGWQTCIDLKKGKIEIAKRLHGLSEHEQANLRRATSEISLFWTMWLLLQAEGKVGDKDRNWIEKMYLYQIHRMHLEIGASVPGIGIWSNAITLLQSPMPTISTFETIKKLTEITNIFRAVQSGRFEGYPIYLRDVVYAVPYAKQVIKGVDFDESMFNIYEKDMFYMFSDDWSD